MRFQIRNHYALSLSLENLLKAQLYSTNSCAKKVMLLDWHSVDSVSYYFENDVTNSKEIFFEHHNSFSFNPIFITFSH